MASETGAVPTAAELERLWAVAERRAAERDEAESRFDSLDVESATVDEAAALMSRRDGARHMAACASAAASAYAQRLEGHERAVREERERVCQHIRSLYERVAGTQQSLSFHQGNQNASFSAAAVSAAAEARAAIPRLQAELREREQELDEYKRQHPEEAAQVERERSGAAAAAAAQAQAGAAERERQGQAWTRYAYRQTGGEGGV